MVFKEDDKGYYKYVILGLTLLILSIVIINIESRYKTKFLLILFVVLVIASFLILPNYYRAWWDKNYRNKYSPKKDVKMIILVLLALFLISLSFISQVLFYIPMLAIILLIFASIPAIYVIALFMVENYKFSRHLTRMKHGIFWFIFGIVLALIILLVRYIILDYSPFF